jgi:ligand-binding sensor domain-containing protein
VVATGLLNPRGLAFAPNGTLYVGEAGSGGPTDIGGGTFIGTTSRISAINLRGSLPAAARPFATGFISVANQDGSEATGLDGVSTQGGRILGIITGAPQFVGAPPVAAVKNAASIVDVATAQLGRLIQAEPSGHWKTAGNVGGTDFDYTLACSQGAPVSPPCDPTNTDFPDSNPYGVLALPGGTYVADAGANTLDFVAANGSVKILAFFFDPGGSPIPFNDEVPTCVTQTGGKLYIGTLNGRVWQYDGTPTLHQVALNTPPGPPILTVGGCTSDAAGNLYLTDQFGGAVWMRAPNGDTTLVSDAVPDPSGIAVGPNGFLYVSQNSTSTNGQVVRLHP